MHHQTIIHFHNESQSNITIKELHQKYPIHQIERGIIMEQCISHPTPRHPARLLSRIGHMLAVARQRRRLLHFSDRLLDDMGIDRGAAVREANRPVWDVPKGWLRDN
jgi:uncharacterized protein YjiS (DUF1127 family)